MAFDTVDGYPDNTSTLIQTQDYGTKIAKAGYDALTAPEQELLFNSSWPSLQIVKVVDLSDYDVSGATLNPIEHGLTFPPFAVLMGEFDTYYGSNSTYNGFYPVPVDETHVYANNTSSSVTPSLTRLVIYNLDITRDIEYPYKERSGSTVSYDTDYGIKAVKETEDITSSDMRDYLLHSRCQSPLVMAVKTQDTINPANISSGQKLIQYTSPLNFISFAFGFVRWTESAFYSNLYTYAPYQGQAYPVMSSNGFKNQLTLIDEDTTAGSIVVLRSPMFSETNEYTASY